MDKEESFVSWNPLTWGLWNSPCSLKCWLNSSFFGIMHRCVFVLPPENPAKRKQPEAAYWRCGFIRLLFHNFANLEVYFSTQNWRSWHVWNHTAH